MLLLFSFFLPDLWWCSGGGTNHSVLWCGLPALLPSEFSEVSSTPQHHQAKPDPTPNHQYPPHLCTICPKVLLPVAMSDEPSKVKMKMGKTQKGNPKIIDDEGYEYRKMKERGEVIYWICTNSTKADKDQRCSHKIHTDLECFFIKIIQ